MLLFSVIYGVALLGNLLCCLLLDSYKIWNCALVAATLFVGLVLQILTTLPNLKDGFRISLPFLFVVINIVQTVAGILSPDGIKNNWAFLTIVVLLFVQIVIYAAVWVVSEKNSRLW